MPSSPDRFSSAAFDDRCRTDDVEGAILTALGKNDDAIVEPLPGLRRAEIGADESHAEVAEASVGP
jgi:hypothetical protein